MPNFMMNSKTLTKDIILPILEMMNSIAKMPSERGEYKNDTEVATIALDKIVQEYLQSREIYPVDSGFFRLHIKIEDEYKKYLLKFLSDILERFADKFIISRKTTTLLSSSLSIFLSQTNIRESYPLSEYNTLKRKEWKDRLLIIDFIKFLNTQRTNCESSSKSGEFSKLISCLKIFIFNEIASALLAPVNIDLRHE